MLQSFRLKIGLIAFCVSGLLLLGFGLFALSALNRVGRERIDLELKALADAQVRKSQPEGHWRRFDESLRSIYGDAASRQFVVVATRRSGEPIYSTPNWPADLPRKVIPLPLGPAPETITPPPRGNDAEPPPRNDEDARRRPFEEPPGRRQPPPPMQVQGPVFATLAAPSGEWRAIAYGNEEVTFTVAMNLSGLYAEMRRFRQALLIAVPLGLLLIAAGGWLLGHMALSPVNRIARTAESVTTRRLNERIPVAGADTEFKHLIELINGMLDRLERGFQQATRFSADAAHELKTPLAILQAQLERSLQQAGDGTPEQREFAAQLDEVQRLKGILRKLLLLSQADAGLLPLNADRVDLAPLIRGAAEDVKMMAPDRRVGVEIPAGLTVTGDADLLNQVIDNLVSNAVKFGDTGGLIEFVLERRDQRAVITVTNTGTPIPEADQTRLFDRFFRGDPARSRDIEGSGLGLNLAREIARAHGGDLKLRASNIHATTFELCLPLPVS